MLVSIDMSVRRDMFSGPKHSDIRLFLSFLTARTGLVTVVAMRCSQPMFYSVKIQVCSAIKNQWKEPREPFSSKVTGNQGSGICSRIKPSAG